jgi:hypothetical protein
MRAGLLLDADEQVASYLFKSHVSPVMKYDRAIGLVDSGNLHGGILLQSWNGTNIELSYYGRGTLTAGIVRCLARILLSTFNPGRVTVTVCRKHRRLIKALGKLGFVFEGTQRCFYGQRDCARNTGVRFVMFRGRLEIMARLQPEESEQYHARPK